MGIATDPNVGSVAVISLVPRGQMLFATTTTTTAATAATSAVGIAAARTLLGVWSWFHDT